jgi:hypothetical protein
MTISEIDLIAAFHDLVFQNTRKFLDRLNGSGLSAQESIFLNFCRLLEKDVVMCCLKRAAGVSACVHKRTE